MIYKKWNRSSAFSPEVVAALNTAIEQAVSAALEILSSILTSLTDSQRAEAIQLIAQGATDGVAAFAESLKQ
jgi:hypothetical protein